MVAFRLDEFRPERSTCRLTPCLVDGLSNDASGRNCRSDDHTGDSPTGDSFAAEHEERLRKEEHEGGRESAGNERETEDAAEIPGKRGPVSFVNEDQDVRLRRQRDGRDRDSIDNTFQNRESTVVLLIEEMGP